MYYYSSIENRDKQKKDLLDTRIKWNSTDSYEIEALRIIAKLRNIDSSPPYNKVKFPYPNIANSKRDNFVNYARNGQLNNETNDTSKNIPNRNQGNLINYTRRKAFNERLLPYNRSNNRTRTY